MITIQAFRTLAAAILWSAQCAYAQAPPGERNVLISGEGTVTCGRWLEQKQDSSLRALRVQWLLGYLTGYNMFNPTRQVELPDTESGMAFIDQYCTNNSLHRTFMAANALIGELGGPPAKQNWKR